MSRRLQYAFEDVSGYDGWARIAAKIARASVVGVFGVLRIMFGLFTSPSKVSEHPVKATTAAIAVCSAFLLAMLTKAWYGVVKATYRPSGGRAGFVGGGGGRPERGGRIGSAWRRIGAAWKTRSGGSRTRCPRPSRSERERARANDRPS